jgi:hypothetical protein
MKSGRDFHRRRLLGQSRPRRLGRDPALQRQGQGTVRRRGVETTNNRMELMAAIKALNALKEPCEVLLHTDSKYVMDGISKLDHGWKRNGWKTADKKPVKNMRAVAGARRGARRHKVTLALGQGPCRPCRERARRRTGARWAWRRSRKVRAKGLEASTALASGAPTAASRMRAAPESTRALPGAFLDIERGHDAVVDDHREAPERVPMPPASRCRRRGRSPWRIARCRRPGTVDLAFAAGRLAQAS